MQAIKVCLTAFLLTCIIDSLSAQYRNGYFRIGISTGTTHYLGDLDDDLTLKFTKPGFGITGSYRFNSFMTARLSYFQGWARASDEKSKDLARARRNLSFRTPISEFGATVAFDFIPTDRSYIYRPFFSPYIFGGVAIFSFNPQAQLNGQWIELQPLGTEGQFLPDPNDIYPEPYKLTQVAIPIGAGLRFNLFRNFDIEIETGFRKTFTDYLDDVSHLYPDLAELGATNPTAAILSDRIDTSLYPDGAASVNGIRGDRTQTDWYIFTNVTVSYIIDWVKCPAF